MKYSKNSHSVLVTNGARNVALSERAELDYYATEPKAVDLLLEQEEFSSVVWECACGEGHLAERIKQHGIEVVATDIVDRGYGEERDFFSTDSPPAPDVDIITNPPYSCAKEFVEHAINILETGHKVAMFLKIQFLESQQRRILFDKFPPKTVYISSNRLRCAKNGDFEKARNANAMCYAWYVWVKGWNGDTTLKWIN